MEHQMARRAMIRWDMAAWRMTLCRPARWATTPRPSRANQHKPGPFPGSSGAVIGDICGIPASARTVTDPCCFDIRLRRNDDGSLLWLWCKFLTWLKQDYVSVSFHAASTASHIVDSVLV